MSAREDLSTLRIPPHSVEAEQSVLGALLLDNRVLDAVAAMLRTESFYSHAHGLIFDAISRLVLACKPADVLTVFDALGSRAEEVGGLAYLNALAQSVPGASNSRRYAEIVADKALRRGVIAASDAMATMAWGEMATADIVDAAAAAVAKLERRLSRKAPSAMHELVLRALDRYDELAAGRRDAGWSTGVAPLDRMLAKGLRRGKVYCVAARPSVGKSSLARHMALRVARDGHATLLLSQEMPIDEVTDCVVAAVGRIENTRLQTGALVEEDWTRIAESADEIGRLPLWVDDEGSLTISQIRAKARSIKGVEAVVLDYLQLCSSTLRNASTNDQIAEISKGLKALALELDIPVVVLSQLNRDVERRADKEPQMSDLRDSGAIEQDSDVVVMLWTAREETEHDKSRLVGCRIAKNRGGPKGRFALRFEPAIYGWHESAESLDARKPATKRFE